MRKTLFRIFRRCTPRKHPSHAQLKMDNSPSLTWVGIAILFFIVLASGTIGVVTKQPRLSREWFV